MAEQVLSLKESSNVKGAVYDADTQKLTVQFHSGHSGVYSGVDVQTADAFQSADSPGKFLASVLKPQFPYTKIG